MTTHLKSEFDRYPIFFSSEILIIYFCRDYLFIKLSRTYIYGSSSVELKLYAEKNVFNKLFWIY